MQEITLGVIEARFADMIWENAPVPSSRLVALAQDSLGWKKSTTYTVLKRLCDKGVFENNGGTVTAKLTKAEYSALQSQKFVEDSFGGSLPAFLAAFTSGKRLTQQEIAELRSMIQSYEEG